MRAAREEGKLSPLLIEVEVGLYLYQGDLVEAIRVLESNFTDVPRLRVELIKLAVRIDDRERALALVQELDHGALTAQQHLELARLAVELRSPRALELATTAKERNPDDPLAHLGLFFAVLQTDPTDPKVVPPAQVSESSVVILKADDEEDFIVRLMPTGPTRLDKRQFGPEHDFAGSLLGRHIGDVVEFRSGPAKWRATVQEIITPTIADFRDTAEGFRIRFPGHPGIVRMTADAEGFDKLRELRQQAEAEFEEGYSLYIDSDIVTLEAAAQAMNLHPFELWSRTVPMAFGLQFSTASVQPTEGAQAVVAQSSPTCVLDMTSLITISFLGGCPRRCGI